jgi:hypothetical protein
LVSRDRTLASTFPFQIKDVDGRTKSGHDTVALSATVNVSAAWHEFAAAECANYLADAGYVST